jgi:hypothetical protein
MGALTLTTMNLYRRFYVDAAAQNRRTFQHCTEIMLCNPRSIYNQESIYTTRYLLTQYLHHNQLERPHYLALPDTSGYNSK